LDAEHALLLVAADAAPEQHRAAVRARVHARLQHRGAPALAHDAHDQAWILHGHAPCFPLFQRTITPTAITDMLRARAISATRPKPLTRGSAAPLEEEARSAAASRNELASAPVATPPAWAATGTKSLLL